MKKLRKYIIAIIILTVLIYSAVNTAYFLYPKKYETIVMKYSEKYQLSPYLVWAIIKTESNYNENARSHKDAIGLMQIRPGTGEWLAKKLNIENYTTEKLYDTDINIQIGCWYIKNLIEQYNNIDTALAAYNGGSGNVSKWLVNPEYSDDGVNIKNIPFGETKRYVEKIKINKKIYEFLY